MNRLLLVIYFCLFVVNLNSQVLHTDSSEVRQTKPDNIFLKPETNNMFNMMPGQLTKEYGLLIPEDLFQLRMHNSFNNTFSSYTPELPLSPLFLTSSLEGTLSRNKNELFTYFHNIYLQSRPTNLQKIFSAVNFSGAFLLAGYYLWEHNIKKENKSK